MGTEKRERQKAGRAARLQEQAAVTKRTQQRRTLQGAGLVVVVVLAVFVILAITQSGKDKKTASTPTTNAASAKVSCPKADGSSPRRIDFGSDKPPNCLTAGKAYSATMKTTAGTVVVDLDTTRTPKTTNNFVFLSRYHYYDGTDFFRVARSIDIIQGGSPHTQTNSDPGPGYTIDDEPALTTDSAGQPHGTYTYSPGDLVMARTGAPNSASAQFFFSTGPNTAGLDSQGTYVVFGHVSSGLDVLQKIVATAKDGPNGEQVADPPVKVTSVTISEH